jgi:hypothetical protein
MPQKKLIINISFVILLELYAIPRRLQDKLAAVFAKKL